MKFSKRIGKVPVSKKIQIESLDDDLKNGLWDAINLFILRELENERSFSRKNDKFDNFAKILWHLFYKLPIDRIPDNSYSCIQFIRDRFYKGQWYEVYDFIEFMSRIDGDNFNIEIEQFKEFCNEILEREFSGYRFIDDKVSPITNTHEIEEIEIAINQSGQLSILKGANTHLLSALEKISDRKSPDYRNSIKESISAVESVVKVISVKDGGSLPSAIDRVAGKIKMHPSLQNGYKQLYNYTSDSDGIRHALMDNPNCDFEDAKYMLVSCSAFINYLLVKASKAGITFN